MSSHLFTYGAAQSAAAPTPPLATVYTRRSLAQSYLSGSDPLSASSMYGADGLGAYSDAARATLYMMSSWPAPDSEPCPPGFKRSSEAWVLLSACTTLKLAPASMFATCRFDHPPPGEVVAMAASQAKSDSSGGKAQAVESRQEQQ